MLDITKITEPVKILETRSKRKHNLISLPVHVDTETSKHIEYDEDGNITECYGWIYLYGIEFAGAYGTGRKPSELLADLELIRNHFGCSEDGTHLVVYIHNLSFDIQYLKDFLISRYGGNFDLLAIAPHRFITFRINAFEFRCSLKLSNRRLAKWANDLQVENRKAEGEIDYSEKHYQDEPLSENQYHYMQQDVLTLKDCVKEQMRVFKDNLLTIPLTSTGYVRRDVRRNFRNERGAVERFRKARLNPTTYVMANSAFSGGLTHGNRFYAGEIVKVSELREKYGPDVKILHGDFRSHYPTQQRARPLGFPKGKFVLYWTCRNGKEISLKQVFDYAKKHCLLIEIIISKLVIKPGVTLPYAQKCKWVDGKCGEWPDDDKPIEDNGRLLKCTGAARLTLTELDLLILDDQYNFSYKVTRIYSATRGTIPPYLEKTVDYYFREKSRLKDRVEELQKINGKSDDIREAKRDLAIVKARLNAIYGCTATNPVRTSFYMDTMGKWSVEELTAQLLKEKLDKFYNNYNSCMAYQYGLYTTALARYQTWYIIAKVIGYEHFLYCDTDSAFYIATPEVQKRIEDYNRKHEEAAEENGAYVEYDGKKVYYDNFSDEGEEITEFCFLHAKAYTYIDQRGLHVTVAGVNEKNTVSGVTREEELGSIENFHSNFVFRECGGTRSIYVEDKPHTIIEDGHEIELAGACVLDNVTKTLSLSQQKGNILYDSEFTINDSIL